MSHEPSYYPQLTFDFTGNITWKSDGIFVRSGTKYTMTPQWVPTIAAGTTLTASFGISGGNTPSNFVFSQTMPPINSCNDPSLQTRGSFGSKVLAPYLDITLMNANLTDPGGPLDKTGQKFFTLAFITAQQLPDCTVVPSWAGVMPLSGWVYYDQIKTLRQNGGDVIISFGGANGIELAEAIADVSSLVKAYQAVINMYKLRWVDFDVEGGSLAGTTSVNLRNQALRQLKANNPGLVISYTLPVLPSGLTMDGVNLLQNAVNVGFTPDVVNIMAMDYGDSAAPNPDGQMGKYAIDAATATLAQVRGVGLSNTKIGLTPMIGKNDVTTEIFRFADATKLANFARDTPWMREVAFWSVSRDNYDNTTYVSASASSIPQTPYQFLKAFQAGMQ